jgi:hypothetical protein
LDFLEKKLAGFSESASQAEIKYIETFQNNITAGIKYYKDLFSSWKVKMYNVKSEIIHDLESLEMKLINIVEEKIGVKEMAE